MDMKGAGMKWNVATAKQKLPQLLRQAENGPQLIYNRNRFVAAVIPAASYEAFLAWQESQGSLWDDFSQLQKLCAEEDYILETPPRENRANPFGDD